MVGLTHMHPGLQLDYLSLKGSNWFASFGCAYSFEFRQHVLQSIINQICMDVYDTKFERSSDVDPGLLIGSCYDVY